ncbi:putative histone H1.0-A-like [Apostichopus japonicus]|uniref:Putative histone H1.0-A-like n=1 Tax=Stichopus japonicus TaxID=307972 RepID=A0A2G8LCY5_STIJA|nr:putative histone H1.0-A-like [Apostichopus japonicus]
MSVQQKKAKPSKPAGPTTLDLIKKAIADLNDPKGSSGTAIKKQMAAKGIVKSNVIVNKALKRGVETGVLKQVKGTGASGTFRLDTAKAKQAQKEKEKKVKDQAKKKAAQEKNKAKKAAAKAKKSAAKKKPAVKKTAAKKTKKKAASSSKPKKTVKPKKAVKKPVKKTAKKSLPRRQQRRQRNRWSQQLIPVRWLQFQISTALFRATTSSRKIGSSFLLKHAFVLSFHFWVGHVVLLQCHFTTVPK